MPMPPIPRSTRSLQLHIDCDTVICTMAHDPHLTDSPLTELSLDSIVEALRAQGMRITKNRVQILRTLLTAKAPLSLDEIQEQSGTEGVLPDYATVFRVMTLLEDLRIAQKVNLNRSCSYYELIDPQQHYDHIVCTECGKVTLMVDECPVEKVERKIERQYGYSDLRHSLEFFGKCPECK
jgi:Fe2+ or Zn2+ uptake regulation protein